MLGQALSRQAEEEERQRREAEESAASRTASTPPDVVASGHASNDSENNIVDSGHGGAEGLVGSSIGGPMEGLQEGGGGGGRYGSILSDASELEGGAFVVYEDDGDDGDNSDYSYDDEEEDYDDDDDDDDNDDSNYSSYDEEDDDEMDPGNEEAYLLRKQLRRRRQRRRRRRRRQEREQQLLEKELQKANSQSPLAKTFRRWKTSLRRKARKVGSRLRAAIVAIADVDNVWDSPDANGGNHWEDGNGAYNHYQRRIYDEQSASSSRNNNDPNGNIYGKQNSTGFTGSAANRQNLTSSQLQRQPFLQQQNKTHQNIIPSDLQQPQQQQQITHQNQQQQQSRSTLIYNAITGGTANARNKTAALFWFLLLSFSYASERSTFKLIVDRVGPFRLFSAELIVGAHAILLGLVLVGGVVWKKELHEWSGGGGGSGNRYHVGVMDSGGGLGVPLADVGLMAVLDTVYLLLGVISGAHVPPVLTVILVQTTIPLTACFTQCVHPDGRCVRPDPESNDQSSPAGNSASQSRPNITTNNNDANSPAASSAARSNIRILSDANDLPSISDYPEISTIPNLPPQPPPPVKGWGGLSRYHIIGTGLLTLAILIGLTPAVLSLDQIVITKKDAIPIRTAYNTIVFCLAAIPAAMSQLYKEHTLTRIRQPIDRNQLNMVLSIFQLLFAIVVSPLAYGLQGMGDGPGWTTLYPSKQIGENFSNGLKCFIGTLDEETMKHGYPEVAECDWAWLLVLLHVFSIVMVAVAIDKLAAATKVMYRGVSMGIMFAVLFMFIYQSREKWCEYGPLVNMMHFTSTVVLIVGAEIYHRVSLADATFETVYQEIGDLYLEEE